MAIAPSYRFPRSDGWAGADAFVVVSTSSFTVDDTTVNQSAFSTGRPIRYRGTGGTWRYGIVVSYGAGAVVFAGAPMTAADDDELEWSTKARLVPIHGAVPGRFADAASTSLLESDDLQLLPWGEDKAYLVQLAVRSLVDDSGGSQPHVGCTLAGAQVCFDGVTNEGPECVDSAWGVSGVEISVANYAIERDEAIELTTDAAGGNNDSTDLSFRLTFVLA